MRNLKRIMVWAFAAALSALPLHGEVAPASTPITVDGKLDEGAWLNAKSYGGFVPLTASGKSDVKAATSFKVLCDKDSVYFGVVCSEPMIDKVKFDPSGALWGGETIELFLSPSGESDQYYQFAVNAGNRRFSMFYAEAGKIRPDDYLPKWESATARLKDGWSLEIRIPLSSFYMTRNNRWNTEWRVNLARTRKTVRETSSWSRLDNNHHEAARFRKISGFPVRSPMADIRVADVRPDIAGSLDGQLSGSLAVTVDAESGAAGDWQLSVSVPGGNSQTVPFKAVGGKQRVTVTGLRFPEGMNGKIPLRLTLRSGNLSVERDFPVRAEYRPLCIRLTTPEYRNNFYPGDASNRIAGELAVKTSVDPRTKITVSLCGETVPLQTKVLESSGKSIPFEFEFPALAEGKSVTVSAKLVGPGGSAAAETSVVVRRPAPPAGEKGLVWIKNGHLVLDGKPWYLRSLYARYFQGGERFRQRFDSDDLGMTPFSWVNLCACFLVPGLEEREGRLDVKPSDEILKKLRAKVLAPKPKNFRGYYISDEPECRGVSPIWLGYMYEMIRELDPFHPVITCTRSPVEYIDCADMVLIHAYIDPVKTGNGRVYEIPVDRVRNCFDAVTALNRPDKVAGFTGQLFSYKFQNVNADYPHWGELESMNWSVLAHGSHASYPYAYHDLGDRPQIYEGFRYFNTSIAALEPWLLEGKKIPAVSDNPDAKLDLLLLETGVGKVMIAVNPFNRPAKATVSSDGLKTPAQWHEFRGSRIYTPRDGRLSLDLAPWQCVVLTTVKLDAGLSSREAVLKKIASAEALRGSRGNLMFEKGAEVEIDSSNPNRSGTLGIRNKIFDGTLDMLAWESIGYPRLHWFEIDFPKVSPEFSRITVHGKNVGEAAVKIWKFGEWKTLEPVKTERGTWHTALDFGKKWKTVKLRIEFDRRKLPRSSVEIYEIELLR